MTAQQVDVKGLMFDASVAPLVPYMDSVNTYRDVLQRLQDVWDQLTLLGQMSGIASDITSTATEFASLTTNMLNFLARRQMHEANHAMRAKAQVAIDVLVRNLFERTADVGFLATDTALRGYLQALPGMQPAEREAARAALEQRFRAYVAKYSVYDDVLVLSPQGELLARLDRSVTATHCRHALVQASLQPHQPYVESFGDMDVLDGRRALVYSAGIRHADNGAPLGVLGLCFRFDDEMRGIFAHLAPAGQPGVMALLDASGVVLASSDPWQIPPGAPLAIEPDGQLQRTYFAGRDYLAVATRATPYQGYPGPGWVGCTLVPLTQAFAQTSSPRGHTTQTQRTPEAAWFSSALFEDDLRRIPEQAKRIQRGLERSVWNGEVRGRQASDRRSSESRFAAALLRQVTVTGARIKNVFEGAIGELQQRAVTSILEEARFRSALAIDIMDRNLYERANDCRWWALDGSLQRALIQQDAQTARQADAVLAHINSLYTVYSLLLLLDAQGQVVATSREEARDWVGRRLDAPWVQGLGGLSNDQAYVRSGFDASPLYGAQHTYVYAAAVHGTAGAMAAGRLANKVVGGTAIVFDSTPQFQAMLYDCLPRQADGEPMAGASGLFVTRAGQVVSSTQADLATTGQPLRFMSQLPRLARGGSASLLLEQDGSVYAVGMSMARGYREYGSDARTSDADVACLVMIRLCERTCTADDGGDESFHVLALQERAAAADAEVCEIASFACAGQWLGLPVQQVVMALEATQFTTLPGAPACMAGALVHDGVVVPVLDLQALRMGGRSHPTGAPRPVVLCRTTDGQALGLLVDELAGIFTTPASALQGLPGYLVAHDPYAVGMVRGRDAARSMLTLLDVDRIAGVLRDVPQAAATATATATAAEGARADAQALRGATPSVLAA